MNLLERPYLEAIFYGYPGVKHFIRKEGIWNSTLLKALFLIRNNALFFILILNSMFTH
jgi:hypothetical protein